MNWLCFGDFVHFYVVSAYLFHGFWGVEAKTECLQEIIKEKNGYIFHGSLNSQVGKEKKAMLFIHILANTSQSKAEIKRHTYRDPRLSSTCSS